MRRVRVRKKVAKDEQIKLVYGKGYVDGWAGGLTDGRAESQAKIEELERRIRFLEATEPGKERHPLTSNAPIFAPIFNNRR